MSSKLDELRQQVSDLFKNATEKEIIEKAAVVSNTIDAAQAEEKALIDKNADLMKSYKDLVLHTSFKDAPAPENKPIPQAPSFEDMLSNYVAKNDEDKK